MKRFTIYLLGLVFSSTYGQALKRFDYLIDFGTSISIPYKSKIEYWPGNSNSPIISYGSNIGYFIEANLAYKLNNKYSLCSGLNFIDSKFRVNENRGILQRNGNLNNLYLTIPVLMKVKLSSNFPIKLGLGTYLGFILSAKQKGTSQIDYSQIDLSNDPILINVPDSFNEDVKSYYKPLDFGLSGQFDYEYKIFKKQVCFAFAKLNFGLPNIRIDNYPYDWKNYNLLIGTGIKL